MIDEKKLIEELYALADKESKKCDEAAEANLTDVVVKYNYGESCYFNAVETVNSQPKIGEWIPCSERLPENEKDVEITFIRQHCCTGEKLYLTARAFYEDGTLTTENSVYYWEEMDNWEYDKETDSYRIPEGWFESVSFAEEFERVDMPVIAWRTLTEPYKEGKYAKIDNKK